VFYNQLPQYAGLAQGSAGEYAGMDCMPEKARIQQGINPMYSDERRNKAGINRHAQIIRNYEMLITIRTNKKAPVTVLEHCFRGLMYLTIINNIDEGSNKIVSESNFFSVTENYFLW